MLGIHAAALTHAPAPPSSLIDRVIEASGRTSRPAQRQLFLAIAAHLSDRAGTLLAEAQTGSGKTASFVCGAVEALRAGRCRRVVVAVPTISLMEQVRQELELVFAAAPGDESAAYLRGAQQFISQHRLYSLIDEPGSGPHVPALRDWCAAQRDAAWPWDAASFHAAFPQLPVLRLDAGCSDGDAGRIAYRAQFEDAADASIVVTTHAMLAAHVKLLRIRAIRTAKAAGAAPTFDRWLSQRARGDTTLAFDRWVNELAMAFSDEVEAAVLPEFDGLIIDEGHLLEPSMASALSSELSLFSLLHEAALPASARRAVSNAFDELMRLGMSADGDAIRLAESRPAVQSLESFAAALRTVRCKEPCIQYTRSVLAILLRLYRVPSFRAEVEFSPILRYPSLRVGPRRIEAQMDALWRSARASVVVSATLLLPKPGSVAPSDSYLRTVLCCPSTSTVSIQVPAVDWISKPVTAFVCPDAALLPPDREAKPERHAAWSSSLADFLAEHVLPSAAGGTLILCTSYADADRLAAELHGRGFAVLAATRNRPIQRQREAFEHAWRIGARPVWLAVGAAWTGMDLVPTGVPAAADTLLTDLVIPRVPFGVNRSVTHQERVARLGWWAELSSMLLTLKQGIGRLVRREGIPANRRLWILDGRVVAPSTRRRYGTAVQQLLGMYRRA